MGDRSADNVPRSISVALLELHYVCLVQARSFGLLHPNGAILSSMGGRVPIKTMLEVADAAGYTGRILTVWWKEQSEPESVIGGYAEHEQQGLGPVSPHKICTRGMCRTPADNSSSPVPLLSCLRTRASFQRSYSGRGRSSCDGGSGWTLARSPQCCRGAPKASRRGKDWAYGSCHGQRAE